MKKMAKIFAILLLAGLLIGVVESVQAAEVITGKFSAKSADYGDGLELSVSIVGSSNISPSGKLKTMSLTLESNQQALYTAFKAFAEGLSCIVGNPVGHSPDDQDQEGMYFVCPGSNENATVIAWLLLSFPLKIELP